MTAQTNVYLYNQRQLVVLLTTAIAPIGAYEKVYAKNLTISRGVDNILEFSFINQNQKPVDISGKSITCRILNSDGTAILIQKTLTPTLPVTGITTLQLTAGEIEDINSQYCYYSLEIPVGTFSYPVFVNSQGGARGVINIVNSVLPSFVESHRVTIPSHIPPMENGNSVTYYSSSISTADVPVLTTQVYLNNFTGNLQIQGSTTGDFSFYYNIGNSVSYVADSTTRGFNISGFHPYVRFQIVNVGTEPANQQNELDGDVIDILTR